MNQVLRPRPSLLRGLAVLSAIALLLASLRVLGMPLPARSDTLYIATALALAVFVLIDAWRLYRLRSPQLQRQLPGSLSLGRWQDVQLHLSHDHTQPLVLRVFDHVPDEFAYNSLPQTLTLPPARQALVSYRLRPLARGTLHLERCEIVLQSPLRLWESRRYVPLPDSTRVYPDLARLYDDQLPGMENWLSRQGIRALPRRGQGQAFHQLREFRDGDSLRQIDWKATARHRKPIAREYQDERDQQIIFVLDCGRRMRSHDDELSHFDHALNACLLLAHVALRQGDAVGLMSFAADQDRYLAPLKGNRQLSLLLDTVYDLDSTRQAADYTLVAQRLLTRHKRRALVVLVTNVRDEDDEALLGAVKQLERQHQVLVANMREEVLDRLRQAPVQNHEQAMDYCGAIEFLNARANLLERLQAMGVSLLDARPDELGARLVGQYLNMKKAGVL